MRRHLLLSEECLLYGWVICTKRQVQRTSTLLTKHLFRQLFGTISEFDPTLISYVITYDPTSHRTHMLCVSTPEYTIRLWHFHPTTAYIFAS